MGDKTLKRGRKSPQDVQKMNATTTATKTTMDSGNVGQWTAHLKGVRSIMNANGFTRVLRVYIKKDGTADVLGINVKAREYVVGHGAVITNHGDGTASLYWAFGHYYDADDLDIWDEFDGTACVWDEAFDGGF